MSIFTANALGDYALGGSGAVTWLMFLTLYSFAVLQKYKESCVCGAGWGWFDDGCGLLAIRLVVGCWMWVVGCA